jgi:hypothetical protein
LFTATPQTLSGNPKLLTQSSVDEKGMRLFNSLSPVTRRLVQIK